MNHRRTAPFALSLLAFGSLLAGCSSEAAKEAEAVADQRAVVASQRSQLEQVPPPTKSRYMAVHSFEAWQNPYITVQPGMLTLHVLRADANTTAYGVGGMLRPVGARREDVSVTPEKLGEAMSSIPASAWPYGRVVAVEEAHKTPEKQEPVVRRNMEKAVGILNDLGIAAYDMGEGNLR